MLSNRPPVTSQSSTAANPGEVRIHDHRRRVGYCPAMWPPALIPTRPVAVWLFAYAEAVLHEDTFNAFVAANPVDFPSIGGAS